MISTRYFYKRKVKLKNCKRLLNSYIMKAGQKFPAFGYICSEKYSVIHVRAQKNMDTIGRGWAGGRNVNIFSLNEQK